MLLRSIQCDSERCECAGGEGVLVTEKAEQQMLGAYPVVSEATGLFLGEGKRLAGVVGQPLVQRSSLSLVLCTGTILTALQRPKTFDDNGQNQQRLNEEPRTRILYIPAVERVVAALDQDFRKEPAAGRHYSKSVDTCTRG